MRTGTLRRAVYALLVFQRFGSWAQAQQLNDKDLLEKFDKAIRIVMDGNLPSGILRRQSAPNQALARLDSLQYRFVWDGNVYACRIELGEMGYNSLSMDEFLASKQGECGELGNVRIPPGTDLRDANLRGAELSMADLSRVDLTGADLTGADAGWSMLDGARLVGAKLRWAHLAQSQLVGAGLRRADLREAYLGGANLTNADLREADLRGADLVGYKLIRGTPWLPTRLDGADLRRALYDASTKLPFSEDEAGRRGMVKF